MKKTFVLLSILVLSFVLLTGCCLRHEWEDATCETPQTCVKCGETEGEALGHEWEDATCEDPQICSRCDDTKGEALGHKWEDATCETPKTCSVCSETEGEALGHSYGEWQLNGVDVDRTRECANCGSTESQPFDAVAIIGELVHNSAWTGSYAIVSGEVLDVVYNFGSAYATLEFDDQFGVVDTYDGTAYSCTWEFYDCDVNEEGLYSFTIKAVETETQELVDYYILTYNPTSDSELLNPAISISLGGSDLLMYTKD